MIELALDEVFKNRIPIVFKPYHRPIVPFERPFVKRGLNIMVIYDKISMIEVISYKL